MDAVRPRMQFIFQDPMASLDSRMTVGRVIAEWSTVDLDARLAEIWQRRWAYLSDLDALPWSITHGDYSTGNLRLHGGDLIALDWATLGVSPVGFDLAHLALATLDDTIVDDYLDGLQGRYEADAVHFGYRVTVALVGVSRAHWMAAARYRYHRGTSTSSLLTPLDEWPGLRRCRTLVRDARWGTGLDYRGEMRIPPPVLALTAALAQRALTRGAPPPSGVRTAASVATAAVSGAIATAAARQFTRAGTTLDPSDPTRASALVTTGVNSVTRNPMYVGLSGLLLAYAIRRGSWTALLPVAAFVVVIDRLQILSEEAALSAQFGIDYEDYRSGFHAGWARYGLLSRLIRLGRESPDANKDSGGRTRAGGPSPRRTLHCTQATRSPPAGDWSMMR